MTDKSAAPDIEHRLLRSALEYVVLIAETGRKRRPPIESPKGLAQFSSTKRLTNSSLGKIRRIVESDVAFRETVAVGALPELVDEIGRLWLTRPSGWQRQVQRLAAEDDRSQESASVQSQLRRADKRRLAAENAVVRARADIIELTEARSSLDRLLDELRTDVAKLEDERDELRIELRDVRNEARHARDREASAKARLAAAERDRNLASRTAQQAAKVRDDVLASRTEGAATVAEVESALHAARSLANQLESLLPSDDTGSDRPSARAPLSLPGGVLSGSAEAAEHLVRSDAAVLIDGYNVTKLQWSSRSLEEQRTMLLDAVENLARRFGTDVTVVFDGASVMGAHAARRRFVRVMYSPEGVIADDVIRDEVRRLPTSRPVVVVTNDREIIRDVRAEGANTVPSNAFLAVL